MIIETLLWIAITIAFSILMFLKDKFFRDKKYFGIIKTDFKELKIKTHDMKSMSLADQQKLVSTKNDLGEDLPTIVIYTVLFLFGFYALLLFKIPNFITGLCVVTIFATVFAFIVSKLGFDLYHDYHFIDSLINFLYAGILLLYMQTFNTIHPILLIILSIVVLLGFGWIWKKVESWL